MAEVRADDVHVAVLGAGYAGMIATNRLLGSLDAQERRRVRVTVVNPRPVFVERVRLHQLAAGSATSVSRPLGEVLHEDAAVVVGTALMVEPCRRTVTLSTAGGSETALVYDFLVYAVGSSAARLVPGAREHAMALGDVDSATELAARLRSAPAGHRVLVVGGGTTGVEAAAEFAERRPDLDVVLVSARTLLPRMRPAARRAIGRVLRGLGVVVLEDTPVLRLVPGAAHLASGATLPFDTCVLAASFAVPDLARVSGLAVDDLGRLRVDERLRSIDDPRILGAGDAVVLPPAVGAHLRMACAAALPLGAHAAEVVLAQLRGQEPAPASAGFLLQCLSLGRERGYVQLVHPDDSPRAFHVAGGLAARVKEAVCRRVVSAPVAECTRPGAYRWPAGPGGAAA